jgi:hypothetical protein
MRFRVATSPVSNVRHVTGSRRRYQGGESLDPVFRDRRRRRKLTAGANVRYEGNRVAVVQRKESPATVSYLAVSRVILGAGQPL